MASKHVIIELKRTYRDPFIVVGGDFNQWKIDEALVDFPDLKEAEVGPTRKDRCIDRLLVNNLSMHRSFLVGPTSAFQVREIN